MQWITAIGNKWTKMCFWCSTNRSLIATTHPEVVLLDDIKDTFGHPYARCEPLSSHNSSNIYFCSSHYMIASRSTWHLTRLILLKCFSWWTRQGWKYKYYTTRSEFFKSQSTFLPSMCRESELTCSIHRFERKFWCTTSFSSYHAVQIGPIYIRHEWRRTII